VFIPGLEDHFGSLSVVRHGTHGGIGAVSAGRVSWRIDHPCAQREGKPSRGGGSEASAEALQQGAGRDWAPSCRNAPNAKGACLPVTAAHAHMACAALRLRGPWPGRETNPPAGTPPVVSAAQKERVLS
jgi:hypothetical protein